MFNPIVLKTENELNKILRRQKKTGEEVNILFYSLWDKWSNDLSEALRTQPSADWMKNGSKNLYLVNSFDMPHAFTIFKSTKLPHFVKVTKRSVISEDYLPRVYKFLGFKSGNKS